MHADKSPASPLVPAASAAIPAPLRTAPAVRRLTSAGLMQDQREVEIEHGSKIYRLRITQLGKLILTA
ncbi:hemin uptake protein HemP [Pseudoduganella sp. LjRoot289]|uniref:hemin uptake protein HemP n=1 Tax=Pseudoduganella sp. LjRoot289 TaxID=3342314 RepID=UPI003ECECC7A